MKRPIDYRPPDLVTAILGLVIDDDDPGFSIPEAELLDLLSSGEWTRSTVDKAVRELVDFGALRRLTPLRGDPELRLTALGRAWIDQRVEPYVRNPDVGDAETKDPDPEPDLDLD